MIVCLRCDAPGLANIYGVYISGWNRNGHDACEVELVNYVAIYLCCSAHRAQKQRERGDRKREWSAQKNPRQQPMRTSQTCYPSIKSTEPEQNRPRHYFCGQYITKTIESETINEYRAPASPNFDMCRTLLSPQTDASRYGTSRASGGQ